MVYDLFDLPHEASLDRAEILKCYSRESLSELIRLRGRAIEERTGFTLDAEIVTPKGHTRWIRITATVECEDDVPVRIFGMKLDITAEKMMYDQIRYLAEFDILTGLPNRAQFQTALQRLPLRSVGGKPLPCFSLTTPSATGRATIASRKRRNGCSRRAREQTSWRALAAMSSRFSSAATTVSKAWPRSPGQSFGASTALSNGTAPKWMSAHPSGLPSTTHRCVLTSSFAPTPHSTRRRPKARTASRSTRHRPASTSPRWMPPNLSHARTERRPSRTLATDARVWTILQAD